jgi:hypothetical protein
MICDNNTDIPGETLMQILHFVDPDKLLELDGEIIITNRDGGYRAGLFLPYGGKNFGKGNTDKIIIFRRALETEEHLVRILAHEIRHMWQWLHDRDLLADKELSEMDARVYAELMVRKWNEDDWNWKTLVDPKRVYVPIPEEITIALTDKEKRTKLLSCDATATIVKNDLCHRYKNT